MDNLTGTMSSTSTFGSNKLLNLPGELRNQIWSYVLPQGSEVYIKPPHSVQSLALTSRQIRREVLSIYYGENTVNLGMVEGGNKAVMLKGFKKMNATEKKHGRPGFRIDKAKVTISIRLYADEITRLNMCLGLEKFLDCRGFKVTFDTAPIGNVPEKAASCCCRLERAVGWWFVKGDGVLQILERCCGTFPAGMEKLEGSKGWECGLCEKRIWAVPEFEALMGVLA